MTNRESGRRLERQHLVEVGPDPDSDGRSLSGKTVVLCLGNRYMRDDAIGIRVGEALRGLRLRKDVLVDACQTVDLPLLSRYGGASKVIVVDALKSGARPGAVSRYAIAARVGPIRSLPGSHGLQLHDIFDVARDTGLLTCPVVIIGVEPKDCSVGEGLTPELQAALPNAVAAVGKELAG
jgi:hydrogenase maturation protease